MGDWTQEIEREERISPPIHPGEMLREEWLGPLYMNANQLANALGVARQNIYDLVNEKRGVSAEMASGEKIEREVKPLLTSWRSSSRKGRATSARRRTNG